MNNLKSRISKAIALLTHSTFWCFYVFPYRQLMGNELIEGIIINLTEIVESGYATGYGKRVWDIALSLFLLAVWGIIGLVLKLIAWIAELAKRGWQLVG